MVSGPIEMMADRGVLDPLPLFSRVTTTGRVSSPGEGRLKVRRSLFGPRTPGESHEFVRKEAEALLESDCRKWNFDFKKETPYAPTENQRWEWSKVEERLLSRPSEENNRNNITTDDQKEIQRPAISCANTRLRPNINESNISAAVNETQSKLPESFTVIRNKQYQQTTMHDFMKARKRNLSSNSKHDLSTTTSSGDLSSGEAPTKIRKTASSN